MVRSGDIALLWFPFGSQQQSAFKRRPVLVLNKSGTGDDQAVVCVMITGSADRIRNPRDGDIPVTEWESYGLAAASVVRPARFWAAEVSDVNRIIGKADPVFTTAVRKAVGEVIGIK